MWGAIKKAINSNLNKSLDVLIQEKATETNGEVDIINSKTGATTDTGGTASAGSIFAKLNKLLADWTTTRAGYLDTINSNVGTLINGRVVKSVQYGIVYPNPNNTTISEYTIPHNAVEINKSFVILESSLSSNSEYIPCLLSSRATNSFTFGQQMSTSLDFLYIDRLVRCQWQLIEFY